MSFLRRLISHPYWERWVTTLIVVNAITLGLETSETVMARAGGLLLTIDRIILWIFVAEIALRMVVHGRAFWRDPWSWFDTIVVGIALVPATTGLSVLRALRILRVLRLISVVPSLKRVIGALFQALPGMGSIV
ncbi:MAG: ion transporter, partial [Pseudomonadota bacterium]